MKGQVRKVSMVLVVFLIIVNSFPAFGDDTELGQYPSKVEDKTMFDSRNIKEDLILERDKCTSWKPIKDPGLLLYTRGTLKKHAVIRINSNTEFLSMASVEGWSGTGLPKSPIIIENLEIDANGTVAAIFISNITKVHFIIRNCTFHNATGEPSKYKYHGSGILLHNISNNFTTLATLQDNYCHKNIFGIQIINSVKVVVKNNQFYYNWNSIVIYRNRYLKLIKNNCSSNGYGISIENSDYNKIIGNNCSNNNDTFINVPTSGTSDGIGLYLCSHSIVEDNICCSNEGYGIHSNDGTNNIFDKNKCNNNRVGLYLMEFSSKISNNTCISNNYGISYNFGGEDCDISNNFCILNKWGIWVRFATYNYISNNYCYLNSFGIVVVGSHYDQIITDNHCIGNSEVGISFLYNWNANILCFNNTCSKNGLGISLDNSNLNIIKNNSVQINSVSIHLNLSRNNTILNNKCKTNGSNIILVNSSNDNIINNNYFNGAGNYVGSSCKRNVWNISKTIGRNIAGGPYLGGNYWSDYSGVDNNDDGLGDTELPYFPGDSKPLLLYEEFPSAKILENDLSNPTTGDNYTINFTVASFGYIESVFFNYWFDQGKKFNITIMKKSGDKVNGTYSIVVNVPETVFYMYYQIISCNRFGIWENIKSKSLKVIDNDTPEIIPEFSEPPKTGEEFEFEFLITDNIKLESIFFEYWYDYEVNSKHNLSLKTEKNLFSVTFNISKTARNITYILTALDNSSNVRIKNITLSIVDNEKPTISVLCGIPTTGDWFEFEIEIHDNIKIFSEFLDFGFDLETTQRIVLFEDSSYLLKIPDNALILYAKFIAIDESNNREILEISKAVTDNDPPVITNLTSNLPVTGKDFEITCEVLENRLLSNVYVEFWFDNHFRKNITMYQLENKYICNLDIEANASLLNYNIMAIDNSNNSVQINKSMIVIDTIPPEIIDYTQQKPTTGDNFEFKANITDNIGLDNVYLAYWYDNQPPTFVDFNSEYSFVNPPWVKELNYVINATDSNLNSVSISNNLIVLDNDKPIIIDTTIIDQNRILISAEVIDNFAISQVIVEFWFDNEVISKEELSSLSSSYNMKLKIPENAIAFHYSIKAIDNSKNIRNTTLKELLIKGADNQTEKNENQDKNNIKVSQNSYLGLVFLIVILILIVFCIILINIFKTRKRRQRQQNPGLISQTLIAKKAIAKSSEPTILLDKSNYSEPKIEPIKEPPKESKNQIQPSQVLVVPTLSQTALQTDQQIVQQPQLLHIQELKVAPKMPAKQARTILPTTKPIATVTPPPEPASTAHHTTPAQDNRN